MGKFKQYMDAERLLEKHASYCERRDAEKKAMIEQMVGPALQHAGLLTHIPPDGVIGLAGLAGKYFALKPAIRGVKALMEAKTLAGRTGTSLMNGLKMRGTPTANLMLYNPAKPSKAGALFNKVDKASDATSLVYSAGQVLHHFV